MFVLSIGSGRARLSRAGGAIYRVAIGLTLTQYGVAPLARAGQRHPCRMRQPGGFHYEILPMPGAKF
jgi:hypothetical protein